MSIDEPPTKYKSELAALTAIGRYNGSGGQLFVESVIARSPFSGAARAGRDRGEEGVQPPATIQGLRILVADGDGSIGKHTVAELVKLQAIVRQVSTVREVNNAFASGVPFDVLIIGQNLDKREIGDVIPNDGLTAIHVHQNKFGASIHIGGDKHVADQARKLGATTLDKSASSEQLLQAVAGQLDKVTEFRSPRHR